MTPSSRSRVLVTGATGLIGRHVLSLLDEGFETFAVARAGKEFDARVHWLTADLAVPSSARELVERVEPDVLIHLAGVVRGDRSLDAVRPTLTVNLDASVELLEAATRAQVKKVVFSGSLLEEPASGDPMAVPPSPYGASRWASSAYARMFHALFDLPVTILRPSYAYGPGQEPTKLLPYVITSVLQGQSPELASGRRRIDFVFAEDVARAYVAAATADGAVGETIDIGCGELTPVQDVVDAIVGMLKADDHRPRFGAVPERLLEQEIEVDTERAERLLGWTATTGLEEGLRRTIAWYADRMPGGTPRSR
jgi:nucleoside-diphosphate-sugar epimerase